MQRISAMRRNVSVNGLITHTTGPKVAAFVFLLCGVGFSTFFPRLWKGTGRAPSEVKDTGKEASAGSTWRNLASKRDGLR